MKFKNKSIFISFLFIIIAIISGYCNERRLNFGVSIGTGLDLVTPRIEFSGKKWNSKTVVNFNILTDLDFRINLTRLLSIDFRINNDWQMPYSSIILLNSELIETVFFINPKKRTIYINTGIGYSFWMYPFDKEWNNLYKSSGPSIEIGTGFKIYKNISCKIDYELSFPKRENQINSFNSSYIQTNITQGIRLVLTYFLFKL